MSPQFFALHCTLNIHLQFLVMKVERYLPLISLLVRYQDALALIKTQLKRL